MGPGATSECQNSRTAGPPARAVQVLHRRRGRIIPAATSPQPSGRSNGHPDATSKKDHPPQIASSLAPPTRTSNDERDIGPSLFQPYSLRRSSFVPFPHPSSRRCPLHLVFFRVGVRSPFARAPPFFLFRVGVRPPFACRTLTTAGLLSRTDSPGLGPRPSRLPGPRRGPGL
jgi:hypothetical protein